ncbi:sugar transferase [Priestia aryabhattai]|uniref:sugar transferase n=1 Tax=Priestia aryabhattai TaxID=412384 RepID=UPI002380227B|nr:sugar transferase [Priestia aryabhattai]WDW10068.1 sugar transferase [Priestia aryabhattai]
MELEQRDFFADYVIRGDVLEDTKKLRPNILVYLTLKRILDIVFSIAALVVTFPIIFLFVVLIKLETPGSAFFLQERVGYRGKYFKVIKLRSMGVEAEKNGAQWATQNDPRITKVGSFIRKTRIDELPQLVNILKGEMTLIGPRPERPVFTAQFNDEIPGFIKRLQVRPGLTGWAQVNGGYEIEPKDKLLLDLYYIKNQTMILDLKILLKTVKVCITGDGAR